MVGAGGADGRGIGPVSSVGARATSYPNQIVRIVVPFSPAATPTGRRVIADKLTEPEAAGDVENRPCLARSVAKAAADGYTLMLTSTAIRRQ
jgi:hypothetical protein